MTVLPSIMQKLTVKPVFGPGVQRLLAISCVAVAAAISVDTARLVVRYFHPLFYWDQWLTIDQYAAFENGDLRISDLFAQYNEHRIAFPRLVFLLDFVFGQGRNIVNISAIFVVQLLHTILLSLLEIKLNRNLTSVIIIAIVFVLMFNFGQSENFVWGFQVQFVAVYAAASLAFWWFAIAAERRSLDPPAVAYAIGAAAMTMVATYSMSNGIMSAAILILLGLALRAKLPLTTGAAVVAAGLSFFYFYDFHLADVLSPPGFALQHPFEIVKYILIYVGSPAGPFGHAAAGALGFAGLSLALFAAIRMVLDKELSAARAALVAIMAFVVATAIVTAFGRAFLGAQQALSSRYLTPGCVFWSAQIVYWSSLAALKQRNRAVMAIFAALSLVVVIGAIRTHFERRATARGLFQTLNMASDALLSGGDFPEALQNIFPDPDVPERLAPFLDRLHLSIFAWPEARLRGLRLSEAFAEVDDGSCLGGLEMVEAAQESSDFAVAGWAWDRLRKSRVNRIVLVNSHDVITGFASGGWRRPDIPKAAPEVLDKDVGWEGFARLTDRESIRAYAYLEGGSAACFLGAHAAPKEVVPIGAPPVDIDLAALGPVISSQHLLSGGWTLNGYHPSAGAPPLGDAIYGSWSGDDSNQGEAKIGPFIASAGTFALPIVTGPSTGGLSIIVKDAETDVIYVTFKLTVRQQWSALSFTIPPEKASRPLLIIAADKGTRWGQWMAIGEPHAVAK